MPLRYQVFTDRSIEGPAFSSPWYWLATMYVVYFAGSARYCRIHDAWRGLDVKRMDFVETEGVCSEEA